MNDARKLELLRNDGAVRLLQYLHNYTQNKWVSLLEIRSTKLLEKNDYQQWMCLFALCLVDTNFKDSDHTMIRLNEKGKQFMSEPNTLYSENKNTNNAAHKDDELERVFIDRIKKHIPAALSEDASAIMSVTKRAIYEAMFQPRTARKSIELFGTITTTTHEDSPIVAACREAAQEYSNQMATIVINEMLADPKIKNTIRNAIIDLIPSAITDMLQDGLESIIRKEQTRAIDNIQNLKINDMD